ncbi:aldo/keto reductase [Amycolatopsis acidiphila]|uniref:Aldo/keto reductase n=1 Tax=Amycolatopsis acidiphila TaxID=715473 RepID=A0A557ZSE0_9PSEU|nr:aldo/keto reductase [Amycolatopsis acidiphila]TVT14939.1 aldo/keto reductase [Amycolatopsis acidiphila]UIJ63098.1 aldo/keto reductase [Amycolatopsis acidiphila]GHG66118.1 aldo/keto reductase [Amycolatopsis acidiphila]
MQLRVLGRTGVRVSALCLGAMSFGRMGNADHDDSVRIVDRALEAGINFIDTADAYSRGESEEIVGRAIKGRRDDVVLATKFYNPMSSAPNDRGGSRRWITRACEDSLRRLGTDYIDLYQMHRPDPDTDLDETLGALSDLVRQGKVRLIGTSTFPAEELVEAQWTAQRRGHVPFRCEQPPYSLFVRGPERDVFPVCERYGMGAIVWSPLNGGWLTGKYRAGQQAPDGSRFDRLARGSWRVDASSARRKSELLAEIERIGADAGLDLITLSVAFTLAHPAVTSTIIGPRTLEQLESQLPAGEVRLSDEVLDRIDAVVAPGETVDRADFAYEPRAIRHPGLRRVSGS